MHFGYSTSSSNCSRKPWQSNFFQCSTSHSKRPYVVATTPNLHLRGSNTRTTVDCMLVRTKMSITIKGGINDIPQPTIIRCMISILRFFSFSIVLLKHSNACIHQPVKLVTDWPKAFSPIHRANFSSPVMFLNSGMALCMFDGLRRQMAQRRIRYRSARIWPGQSTPYLPLCNRTLPNACPLCKRWHLGQLSGD